MKNFTVLFIVFFQITLMSAKCRGTWFSFWPTGNSVKQNSIFMIEGYALNQELILGLNTSYKFYLKSGKKKILLNVIDSKLGEFAIAQIILKPQELLTEGLEYQLCVDSFPDYDRLFVRRNTIKNADEPIKWTVVRGEDNDNPVWTTIPKVQRKTLNYYGCGPASYVYFNFGINEESEFLLKATVKNLSTEASTTFYIQPDDLTTLKVGHGMCSGPFTFYNGNYYEVTFDLFDASGNKTSWTGDAIKFQKPTDETNDE